MSRALERSMFKNLAQAAKKDYASFMNRADTLRQNVQPYHYPLLLKVYKDVGAQLKNRSWTGKKNIKELGYDCAINSKSLDEDLLLAANWISLHTAQINEFNRITYKLQNLILSEDYTHALEMAENFQRTNGWSFWILEAIFYLTAKVHGSVATRELARKIREQGVGRIINVAATVFSERVDDRYSLEAFISRWTDVIPKYLKKQKTKDFYLFHALGVTDYGDSLGSVICQDLCNSIYDCYTTLIEALYSLIYSNVKPPLDAMLAAATILKENGIDDFRIDKIFVLLGEQAEYSKAGPGTLQATGRIYEALKDHKQIFNQDSELSRQINELNEKGALGYNALTALDKEALSLRFIPAGLALNDFTSNILGKGKTNCQPWLALLSNELALEDLLAFSSDKSWALLEKTHLEGGEKLQKEASILISTKKGSLDKSLISTLPLSAILWMAYEHLKDGRIVDCREISRLLETEGSYWHRESVKLNLAILIQELEIEKAVELACKIIDENPILCFEYPFQKLFIDNSWGDFKSLNPIKTALISHYTNTTLPSKDEDIHYICKMACKRIFDTLGGKNILLQPKDDYAKREAIKLFAKVWIEENLTFLNFKTSREAMNERLEVLRLLVQVDADTQQEYASEIMDITLRESLWEGLSHVDETRIFVNEAGILRWAEKELKQDFESWKKIHALSDSSEITEKILQYSNSPSNERLAEISHGELSEENKLLLSIVERLENKFLNDPLDGLHCYLSARIRHGTIKNTFLGPLDEAGFLAVNNRLDDSVQRYLADLSQIAIDHTVVPALLELSSGLVELINDALLNKIRIKSSKHPTGFIEISKDINIFGKIATVLGSLLEFTHFASVTFNLFWKLLEPSLNRLHNYFSEEFQNKTHEIFDHAIQRIEAIGDDSRGLTSALTRIKNLTCQKCLVAAAWFQPRNDMIDRVFTLEEAINIAIRASKNIYPRFNARVELEQSDCLELKLTSVGMSAIVEALSTLLENCWKYSGLSDKEYVIDIATSLDAKNEIFTLAISNPLSAYRKSQLTEQVISEIRNKFQNTQEVEIIASEGGTGLPKIARLSRKMNRTVCPTPLDIKIEGDNFVAVVFVPLHKRDEAYDVYNY